MALTPFQWSDSKGQKVFKYPRPFPEAPFKDSRISWNPKTGVGELLYNLRTVAPLNSRATEKRLGWTLKRAFGTQKYICIVGMSNKIRNEDWYKTEIQFHFKTPQLPEYPERVPAMIEECVVFQSYTGTDIKTGEAEFYEFQDLPGKYRAAIIKQCVDPKISAKKGQEISILGKYWKFAD